jgi:hypothetical protein
MKKILIVIVFICLFAGVYYLYKGRNTESTSRDILQKNEAFYVSGYVSHKSGRDGQWSALDVDSAISDGDAIKTSKDSSVEIKFGRDMKNIISASEQTSIELKKIASSGDKRIALKEGTLLSDLKELDPNSRFEVKTPTAVCGVLGTGFEAQAAERSTIVKVYDGRVYVKGIGFRASLAKETIVEQGNQTLVHKSGVPEPPTPISQADMDKWDKWRNGQAERMFRDFYVFANENDERNHFYPSGWLGDYDAIRRFSWDDNPYSGDNCLRFRYTGRTPQGAGWVGVYWQNPVNNWGDVPGSYDLTGARNLSFWARGEKGGEIIKFGAGGISGEYPDSFKAEIGPVSLTANWKKYEINLAGKDLSSVSGGFFWMADKNANPEGAVIYLDDIKYE